MPRHRPGGLTAGVVAALLWSPHFYVARQMLEGSSQANVLTFYFLVLLWGGAGSLLVLFLMDRTRELSVFKRAQTHLLFLVATGGYGFWLLRAMALQRSVDSPSHVQLLFYAGPLLLGFMSVVTREGAKTGQIVGLILGFVGCIMIAWNPTWKATDGPSPGFHTSLIALASAGCWAVFTLAARPLAKTEKPLALSAIILSMGALCILVTCFSMGTFPSVSPKILWTSILLGLATAICLRSWLACLSTAPAASAAPLWYLSLVFGIFWAWRMAHLSPGWFTLGGIALILVAAHGAGGERVRPQASMSDLVRR